MIISASRRTDIPSDHSEWFMDRIRQGSVIVSNPRNPKQQKTVSLHPQDVDCFVFWSKNPEPMLSHLRELDERGFKYYFQFTLTPYGRDIERNLSSKSHLVEVFKKLSDRIGRERVIWRYDPIIINSSYSADYHIRTFERYASQLSDYTNKCVISFVDMYGFVAKRCTDLIRPLSNDEVSRIAVNFSCVALSNEIELETCSEAYDLSNYGIQKGSCIDKSLIEKIINRSISAPKDRGQRLECGCAKAVDIGSYNSCSNGCIYCYANKSSRL